MSNDNRTAEMHLLEWASQFENAVLPKWDDLPNLPLYMDQVLLLLEQYLTPSQDDERTITASIVNNYVRMKIMPAPVKKKYTRIHLAYLIVICTLKQSLSISCIQKMLPTNIAEDQVKLLYNDFADRYHEIAVCFAEQIRSNSPPMFHPSDTTDHIGIMAIGTALMANLAQTLTERIILSQVPLNNGE